MGDALGAAGLDHAVCEDLAGLCREIGRGAGAALLTEEALGADRARLIEETLRGHPAWSDFPLVVLAREGAAGERLRPARESMNVLLAVEAALGA